MEDWFNGFCVGKLTSDGLQVGNADGVYDGFSEGWVLGSIDGLLVGTAMGC